jgi:hypothetical protein
MSEEEPGSPACQLGSPPMTLREACRRAGLDRHGARCPDCPVRDLCRSEWRWLVSATPADGWRC